VRGSDAVEAGCLGSVAVGKGADGSRLPWARRGGRAKQSLWQPYNTAPESNAAELLGRRIDLAKPATPINRGLAGLN
jgi:hypothetical protein